MNTHNIRFFLAMTTLFFAGCVTTAPQKKQQTAQTPEAPTSESTKAEEIDTVEATPWESAEALSAYCQEALTTITNTRTQLKSGNAEVDLLDTYNNMLIAIDRSMGWASLLANVSPEESVRKAAEKCKQLVADESTKISLDHKLYGVMSKVDTADLDAAGQRFVEHLLRDFRRSGVDQKEATRNRIAKIKADLVKLSQDFSRNVRSDVRKMTITDLSKLDGLPADWIKAHTSKDGKSVTVSTDYPDFYPFQTYCKDEALRKTLYQKFQSRGNPDNKKVLEQVLNLRFELAQLLGHKHWGAYNAGDKMVKNSDVIEKFIKEFSELVKPFAKKDIQGLLARKQKDDKSAKEVQAWDRFFYKTVVRKERFGLNPQELRPYFAYNQVRKGIFSVYSELFGISFKALPTEPVWHKSVEAFEMYLGEELVGKFFLDMHPRKDKFKHAAMFGIQTGLRSGQIPMASLVCNFPNPNENNGLMEHTQVTTYFHEFGHLIHHLMARSHKWVSQGGITTEWDFVEAPSQILEEWAWAPDVLAKFAKHVETGKPIPADLVQKLRKSEDFGKAAWVMRQVFYTAYSYFLHAQDPKKMDLDTFTNSIYKKHSLYPRVPESTVYTNFGHLMGYSSIYYTYMWSLVIAKDLFTRFESDGMMNKAVAKDYRQLILEPGGSRDASDLVRSFLGRDYNMDAFKIWLQGK
ncbi:MAG TPA: hypothetical protein EYN06_00665 [Myxococcales bacterium]|nr:hypothetical protein [Myxococcales bacterium]HIN84960.1 hypothetical protein [Myxococcales bacterium]